MDFKSVGYLIQMQAMSAMKGSESGSLSEGIGSVAFRGVLAAALSPSVQQSSSAVDTPSLSVFQTKPLPVVDVSNQLKTSGGGESVDGYIKDASNKYGVNEQLIRSVVNAESSFNPKAVSHAGAQGLMQLMPDTARGLGVSDPLDPEQNVMGGTKYLRQMLDRYNGDEKLALAAYNAGAGNVDKYGGVPPFKETQQYVKKILG
ncbi:lytic transglycosylase domain-containing protein [Halobacillus rhizosphaerae]|uniref:lytic transglycosylase domain-containing protein n=1 Tax=Halobacillus rhizosphaerae TaxID=3064889 RepID=UPI00398AC7D2